MAVNKQRSVGIGWFIQKSRVIFLRYWESFGLPASLMLRKLSAYLKHFNLLRYLIYLCSPYYSFSSVWLLKVAIFNLFLNIHHCCVKLLCLSSQFTTSLMSRYKPQEEHFASPTNTMSMYKPQVVALLWLISCIGSSLFLWLVCFGFRLKFLWPFKFRIDHVLYCIYFRDGCDHVHDVFWIKLAMVL